MVMTLGAIGTEVAGYASSFDPALVSPTDAERVVAQASKTINMLETVRALAAARAAQGGSWRRDGATSPAQHLARKTGTTVTKAKEELDAGEKLRALPALDAAARAGELSLAQVAPIAEDCARTKVTLLRWLERHCHRCHDLKTRHGGALIDGKGKRPLVPPEDPRHPALGRTAARTRAG